MMHITCAGCSHLTVDGLCAAGMCAVVRAYRRGSHLDVPPEPVRVLAPSNRVHVSTLREARS